MRKRVQSVKHKLDFIPPKLNRALLGFARLISTPYIRYALGLRIEEVEGIEKLSAAYRRYSSGESRLILVFRHVHVHDAPLIFQLVNKYLPRHARKEGKRLPKKPHVYFLYGRGVPLWAGTWLTWLFSRMGGIPVSHRKLDRVSIDMIRRYNERGTYPIALAPEGQVTYHNRHVYEVEPGFAQIALWAAEDSFRNGQSRRVEIVPVSQYYRYGDEPLQELEKVLDAVESELEGLTELYPQAPHRSNTGSLEEAKKRLRTTGARVLNLVELFYRRNYHLHLSHDGASRGGDFSRGRVEEISDAILSLLEERLGIRAPYREFTPRIFTVRQAGWNRIFRLDKREERHKNELRRSMEDYVATEADLLSRHLEVVDILSYLRPDYGVEEDEANMFVETALNLHDTCLRLRGRDISDRLEIRPSYASIQIGEILSISKEEYLSSSESVRTMRAEICEKIYEEFKRLARRSC